MEATCRETSFIRSLRRLVSIPGICQWHILTGGVEVFSFSDKDMVAASMPLVGFKTNKFPSLVRQMNTYEFKNMSQKKAQVNLELEYSQRRSHGGIGGFWLHKDGSFIKDGSRDGEIFKIRKVAKPKSIITKPKYPLLKSSYSRKRRSQSLNRHLDFDVSDNDEDVDQVEDEHGISWCRLSSESRKSTTIEKPGHSALQTFDLAPSSELSSVLRVRVKLNGCCVADSENEFVTAVLPQQLGRIFGWSDLCCTASLILGQIPRSIHHFQDYNDLQEQRIVIDEHSEQNDDLALNLFDTENSALQVDESCDDVSTIRQEKVIASEATTTNLGLSEANVECSWEESLDYIVGSFHDTVTETSIASVDFVGLFKAGQHEYQHHQGIGLPWHNDKALESDTRSETVAGTSADEDEPFSLFHNIHFGF